VSTTQNQLIRYDLKKMADRGILTKNGDGRETTFRVRAA
jgi:predicted MarR family transcription regulator